MVDSAGELRLLSIIGSDMQQARIRQAQRSLSSAGSGGGSGSGGDGPQYFRRVLTGRENCALCIVASTQRYKVSKVLPVHPGCDCGFQPLPKGQDLFHVLDPELLERVHEVVEERTGESNRSADGYKDLLLTVNHSEHGEILSWAVPKAKKRHKITAENHDYLEAFDVGTSRYAKERKNPRSIQNLRADYDKAISTINSLGAVPDGFIPPPLVTNPPKKITEFMKRGMVRGAYDSEDNTIWLNPRADKLGLTSVHELGHAIDFFIGRGKNFASEIQGTVAHEIVSLLRTTPTGEMLLRLGNEYSCSTNEIFARAFAQYIGTCSSDADYLKEVKTLSKGNQFRQWQEAEFELVIPLFRRLFEL